MHSGNTAAKIQSVGQNITPQKFMYTDTVKFQLNLVKCKGGSVILTFT